MSARQDVEAAQGATSRPIAIVGIGCRFADARGPEEFWEIVRSERNTVREVPEHRIELGYDIDHFYDPRPGIPGKISSRLGGFIEHPELFDPAAFGLTPRDAVGMEPQQRLMVEVTWDALVDAGIVPEALQGERVAVILGFMAEDYSRQRTGALGEEAVFRNYDVFTAGGISHAVLSGRISHLLGVTGPSFTLDTACSSSLYATHLACESLQRGESRMAIAGGVNVFLTPEGHIALSRSGMMSPDGKCKAFDAGANGFVRAEGAGVVVLRPLDDALADGNPIYAVIRGTGISSDGRDGGHMMAPGRTGQAQAMRDAYARAGIDPARVQYVETHGTGTVIGDPVEIGALADVMGPGRSPDAPLRVASVKGNLGHAESASGVAGLIKTALAIKHRVLPAQLHFETPSPAIPWDEIPVRVQAETTPWPGEGTALAAVNSFGISGTNAHVILESAPAEAPSGRRSAACPRPSLVTISAHDPAALEQMVTRHRDALRSGGAGSLADLGYTLGCRRAHKALRVNAVAATNEELADELDAYLDGAPSGAVRSGAVTPGVRPELVMVFPGQGSQWLGMGRELLAREPVFRDAVARLDAAYAERVEWSLRDVLDGTVGFDWRERLDVLQPLLVALQVALAELWASWGVRPDRVIGQSMGEIAAAHVAGHLTLDALARLACERGRVVVQASGEGAMGVVGLASETLAPELEAWGGCVEIAGSNSPTTTIVSGDRDAVEGLIAELDARGTFARRLEVEFASHCFHMDPLLDGFRERIRGLTPSGGNVPFVSTVDAEEKAGLELDAEYWIRNLRAPVAFSEAAGAALDTGASVFLEVSPHATLSRAIHEIASARGQQVLCCGSLQREQDEQRSLLGALAELHANGVPVDFDALYPDGRIIATPLFAYQRKRYWFGDRNRAHGFRPTHPLIGARRDSSVDSRQSFWDVTLDRDAAPYLDDFRPGGRAAVPSGLYLELALAVSEQLWPGQATEPREIALRGLLELPEDGRVSLQFVLTRDPDAGGSFRVLSRASDEDEWQLRASGRLCPNAVPADPCESVALDRDAADPLTAAAVFDRLEAAGLSLGQRLRTLRELERLPPECQQEPSLAAHLMLPRVSEPEWHAYRAHPALFENALQLLGEACQHPGALRCVGVGRVRLTASLGSECWCRVTPCASGAQDARLETQLEGDLEFFDAEGVLLGSIEGLRATTLKTPGSARRASEPDLFRIEWSRLDVVPNAAESSVGRWILVSDSAAEAHNLAVELEKQRAGWVFCEKLEDLPRRVARLQRESPAPWGLVLLNWADRSQPQGAEPSAHRAFRIGSWAEAIRTHASEAAQIWIATRGMFDEAARGPAPAILAADLEGFASCRELERCRFFDASTGLEQPERVALAGLLGASTLERQFVARGQTLEVARLCPVRDGIGRADGPSARLVPAGDRNFHAVLEDAEGVACVSLHETGLPGLAADHVEVEVGAAALSQLDVLASLGLSRAGADPGRGLGRDFAGVVTARGESVREFDVGDRVMGLTEGAVARRIAVPVDRLAAAPRGLGLERAAGIPLAYTVACLALDRLAGVRAGERVLVRAATGGIGLAAIAVARARGADVYATSGDAARRAALRALGARVFVDSAATEIGCDAAAAGPDFDVVVGSDVGRALHAALSRLRPGGRYVDLSPRGQFELEEPGALVLGGNRSYCALDLAAFAAMQPHSVTQLLREASRAVDSGEWAPLPVTVYPVREAARALRYLVQNRQLGRVTLAFDGAARVAIRAQPRRTDSGAPGDTVVVTGTRPELQASIAAWLRDRGAPAACAVELAGLEDALAAAEARGTLRGVVHVSSASDPMDERVARRVARVAAEGLASVALVSTREPEDAAAPSERSWEIRAWIDRLRLSATARGIGLSVPHDVAPAQVGRLVERALRADAADPALVVLGAEELASRLGEDASPLFADLVCDRERGAGAHVLRDELLSLVGAERRRAMDRMIGDALAAVLALGEREHASLDLGRKLGELGLDSLMMLELFLGLSRDLELEIAREWFPPDPSAADVAAALLEQLAEARP